MHLRSFLVACISLAIRIFVQVLDTREREIAEEQYTRQGWARVEGRVRHFTCIALVEFRDITWLGFFRH